MKSYFLILMLICFSLVQEESNSRKKESIDNFQFSVDYSPIVFLHHLKQFGATNPSLKGEFVVTPTKNWIGSSDAIRLFEYVGDNEKCLGATNFMSSFAGSGWSTVDVEARRLIEGYVEGKYPRLTAGALPASELKKKVLEKIADEIDSHLHSEE